MNEIDKLRNDKYNLISKLMMLGLTKKDIILKEIYWLQYEIDYIKDIQTENEIEK